jgi:excinuclease ABC subunit C
MGKAKNLKKRVLSYFNKNLSGYRIKIMVSKIQRLETTIVNSEYDALLLENNLIKEHQPFYNVMLKDDKTYPWICIKNEDFPRIFLTRNVIKDGSEYYGPYAKVRPAKILLDTIKHIYKLRTCNLNLRLLKLQTENIKYAWNIILKTVKVLVKILKVKKNMMKIDAIRGIIKGDFRKQRIIW